MSQTVARPRLPRPAPPQQVMVAKLDLEFSGRAWRQLGEEAERQRTSPEELVVHAALYYLAGHTARHLRKGPGGAGKTIRVEFSDFGWSQLREEAAWQGLSAEQLVTGAVHSYLASGPSGRISRRVPHFRSSLETPV
jgi:hypothetical protein